jgi:hypothetical protein
MGKAPLPTVAEVPQAALDEDKQRAAAMVRLLKEASRAEDQRERLLRRARPNDHKTLIRRFKRERARDAQRIHEISQEREAILRASVREHRAAAAPFSPPRDDSDDSDDGRPRARTLDFARPRHEPDPTLMTAQKLAQQKEIIEKFNKLGRPALRAQASARAPPASTRRAGGATGRSAGGPTARRTAALVEKRTLLVRLQGIVNEEQALRGGGATTRRSTARSFTARSFRTPHAPRPSSARSVATNASYATVGSRAGPPPRPRGIRIPQLRL